MARAFCRFAPGRYRREVILCWARYSGAATNRQSVFNEQQRAGAGRSAPAQGSSSNGRGQNIICLPFVRALPAFSNSPAASLGQGANVMVEGETLLVLRLPGRCQHSATVPQPAKKVAVSAKRTVPSTPMQQHWCSKAGLARVQPWG